MGYRNEAENVIRPGHLKRRLIGFGIGAVCIVVAELLILWGNRAYCAARGLEPSLATLLMSFSTLFSWGTLSFSLLDPGNLARILSRLAGPLARQFGDPAVYASLYSFPLEI